METPIQNSLLLSGQSSILNKSNLYCCLIVHSTTYHDFIADQKRIHLLEFIIQTSTDSINDL